MNGKVTDAKANLLRDLIKKFFENKKIGSGGGIKKPDPFRL